MSYLRMLEMNFWDQDMYTNAARRMLGLTGCSDSFRKTLNVIEHGILFAAFLRVYVWISQETIGRMTYFALDFLLRFSPQKLPVGLDFSVTRTDHPCPASYGLVSSMRIPSGSESRDDTSIKIRLLMKKHYRLIFHEDYIITGQHISCLKQAGDHSRAGAN